MDEESILSNLAPPDFVMAEEMMPDHKAGDKRRNPFKTSEPGTKTPREPITERAVPKNKLDIISNGLPGIYKKIGAMVILFDPICGQTIIDSADECAASLVVIARSNPNVANALIKLMEGGAWSAAFMAHAPILMVVWSHHIANRPKNEDEEKEKEPKPSPLRFLRPPTPGAVG